MSYLLLVPLAFFCELIDSGLGMGYGTSLTPILLLMGFEPLQVVPAVLLSEFTTGALAAYCHHNANNVQFTKHSPDTKVALVLGALSVIGAVAAVLIAVKLPGDIAKLWIGGIVVLMGILLLVKRKFKKLSWTGICILGTVASFNKGLSGGGYGPLVMGGQLLSGISTKNAIGITSLAESMTCVVGVFMYLITQQFIDWSLAPWLMCGAVLSVPFAATFLKKIPERTAHYAVAISVLILGCLTLLKVIL